MMGALFCKVKALYLQYYLKRTLPRVFSCELRAIQVFSPQKSVNQLIGIGLCKLINLPNYKKKILFCR